MSEKISVVIIGRNEGERLVRCLESVRAMLQDMPGAEMIYVDSGSTDNSGLRALRFGAAVVELAGRCSAARARNAGWKAAAGEWILFLDGDTIVDANFLKTALQAVTNPRTAAVWGHRRELRPTANFYHRVLDLDWVYAPGVSDFCGGDVLMRRACLEEVGGFDASLIAGEEPELCARLRGAGYEILHIDSPMTGHDLAITRFSQYWRRAVRAGYAYAQLAQRTRSYTQPMWSSETGRNARRALMLAALVLLPPVASLLLRSWIPLAVGVALLGALVVRSAMRSSWKSSDHFTLLCYGVHSHFQQFPILAGQLAYRRDMAQEKQRGLIEYK